MKITVFELEEWERERFEQLAPEHGVTLLAGSDVVSLHVPANEKTPRLMSSRESDKMKDGAVLINTSRGGPADHRHDGGEHQGLRRRQSGKRGRHVRAGWPLRADVRPQPDEQNAAQ